LLYSRNCLAAGVVIVCLDSKCKFTYFANSVLFVFHTSKPFLLFSVTLSVWIKLSQLLFSPDPGSTTFCSSVPFQ
jgi:hypothetical protein